MKLTHFRRVICTRCGHEQRVLCSPRQLSRFWLMGWYLLPLVKHMRCPGCDRNNCLVAWEPHPRHKQVHGQLERGSIPGELRRDRLVDGAGGRV